ncbi:MAG TPA: TlpA disulfide reductase family protein [Anaerolineae bacterium]|nr:TlpA disulfide reductase family protein [Anaerolineae bacterium]HQH38272.1 TlpA disulfide reductase family protein [Anaerolineae bacterium]
MKKEVAALENQVRFSRMVRVGQAVDPFELEDVTTNKLVNLADYQGRGVLLVFFSVNCKYCHQDVVLWQRIADQSDSTHPPVLAIAVGDDALSVAQHARQHELLFPVLLDLDKKVFNGMNLPGTPTKVLLDKDLRVVRVWLGLTSQNSAPADLQMLKQIWDIEAKDLPIAGAIQIQ